VEEVTLTNEILFHTEYVQHKLFVAAKRGANKRWQAYVYYDHTHRRVQEIEAKGTVAELIEELEERYPKWCKQFKWTNNNG